MKYGKYSRLLDGDYQIYGRKKLKIHCRGVKRLEQTFQYNSDDPALFFGCCTIIDSLEDF